MSKAPTPCELVITKEEVERLLREGLELRRKVHKQFLKMRPTVTMMQKRLY